MDQIIMILLAGIFGMIMMDLLNLIFSRIGIISKIEVFMIGRMASGWIHGRFFYNHPEEMIKVEHEVLFGYFTHILIGISLAVPFIFGWNFLIGGIPNFLGAILYGMLTTSASWFYTYPSIGLGVFGLKSSEGFKAAFSSLVNHLFYGIGLAIGILLI